MLAYTGGVYRLDSGTVHLHQVEEKTMNKLTNTLGFAALGLAIAVLPAQSADRIITKTTVVQYADLNLGNPAGARALYTRIQAAARSLCSPARRDHRACVNDAVSEAVSRLNLPLVSALHHGKHTQGSSDFASGLTATAPR
jgi:UrcA family protein